MTWALTVVVALSLALPAGAMLVRRRAPSTAALMLVTATALVASAYDTTTGLVTGLLLGPLVVLAYPRLRWRHPLDLVSLLAVAGAAVVAVAFRTPGAVDTMGLVVLFVLIGHTWWATARAEGAERRAMTWLALSVGGATLAAGVVAFTLDGANAGAPSSWALLPYVVVGPALYLGVSRPEVADTRLLVVDAVAHGTALVLVLAVFVGVAAPLLEPAPSGVVALLGLLAAALAACYRPVQRVLQDTVARAVLGGRPDPLAAVDLVARSLGEDPADALDAVRRSLGLPWAAVLTDPPLSAGARGAGGTVRVPLGDDLPDLELELRDGDSRLTRTEQRVVALAAPLLGQSLRLQLSREQTVQALEAERLRLRRDLHDGLGPLLGGLAYTTDAATNLVTSDPAAATELLGEVRRQAETAMDDVRRLVYGMRPPALDELGLAAAVRQAVADLPLEVHVDSPTELDLPAAVEVAAYRIAVEAVGNAARHSVARRVEVRLEQGADLLRVRVTDDGGPGGAWTPGVGLSSMQERAAEVGGRVQASPTPTGGRVRAELPLSGSRSWSTAG